MKKIFSLLLSIIMLLSITAGLNFSAFALSNSGKCGDNVTYTFNSSTGLLTISGNGEMTNYGSTSSPFYNQSAIKNVVINDGVTSVGDNAFRYSTDLTSVTISNSVTSIGMYAFENCNVLESVTIGDSVTIIGNFAFESCKLLSNVIIPDSVKSIGACAFFGCTQLRSVTISYGVKGIGANAFSFCHSLPYVIIPDSVTRIDVNAFAEVKLIIYSGTATGSPWGADDRCYSIINGFVFSDPDLTELAKYLGDDSSITIPNGVKTIKSEAFKNCNGLKEVRISDSVTSIGDSAFYSCTGLKSVKISNSVTSINNYTFYNCTNLLSITIPDSVLSISNSAFLNCSNLTNININDISLWCSRSYGHKLPNSYSLYVNDKLITDLVIPDGVTSISDNAFYNCTSLASVIFPRSVTHIGNSSFYGVTSDFVIPSSVETIGSNAFSNCFSSRKLVFLGNDTNIKNVVSSIPSNTKVYVLKDSYADQVAKSNGRAVEYIDLNCSESGNHIDASEKYLVKDSTCTETGEFRSDCLICKNVAKTETIPAKGHSYNSGVVTTNPTCTKTGIKTYTCSACGGTYTEIINENGHKWNSGVVTKEPGCETKGIKKYTCTVCGATKTEDVEPIGHLFKKAYNKDGSFAYVYCDRHEVKTLSSSTYPESEHNYANNTDKTYQFKCENARKLNVKFSSNTKVESIYDKITLFDSNGDKIGEYSGSELASRTITVNGDSFSINLKSDRENNYYGFKIDSIVAEISLCDYFEPEHLYDSGVITTEPKCTTDGIKTYTCQYCGDQYTEIIPALNHIFKITEKKPTCTSAGYTTKTCSRCQYSYIAVEIGATGHNYETKITKATTSKNGKSVLSCTRCGDVIKTETISKIDKVKLSKTSVVYNGKTQKPLVKVTDLKGKKISSNNYTVKYSSGFKNAGKYTVTIKFKGNYSGTVKKSYTIKPSIKLNQNHLFVGEKAKIVVGGSKKFTLSSDKKKIATVSKKGSITAKKAGKVKITVKANGVKNTLTLKVEKPSPYLNSSDITLKKYDTYKLKVKNLPNGATVSWKSDNKKIASVSKKGKVTANAIGDAKITATIKFKGKTYKRSCIVSVINRKSSYDDPDDSDDYDDYDGGDDYKPDNSARIAQIKSQISTLEAQIQKDERQLSILEMDTSGMYAGEIARLQSKLASERSQLQSLYTELYSLQ